MTADLTTLRLIVWNAKVGRSRRKVLKTLRHFAAQHQPHAFCLQESEGYSRALVDRRGRSRVAGYVPLIARGWDGAAANPMLVRDDVEVARWRPVAHEAGWTGPKIGKPQPGRTWTDALLGGKDGWRVWGVHRTPEEWGAKVAAAEEFETLVRAGTHTPHRALVIVGDQNSRPADTSRYTTGAVRQVIGGRAVAAPKANGVDWALVRDGHGTARSLGRQGSDHDAVLYVLTRKRDGKTGSGRLHANEIQNMASPEAS